MRPSRQAAADVGAIASGAVGGRDVDCASEGRVRFGNCRRNGADVLDEFAEISGVTRAHPGRMREWTTEFDLKWVYIQAPDCCRAHAPQLRGGGCRRLPYKWFNEDLTRLLIESVL